MSILLSEEQLVSGLQEIYRTRTAAQQQLGSMLQDRERLRQDPRTALPLALYDLSGADLSTLGADSTPKLQQAWEVVERHMLQIVKQTGMITSIWADDHDFDDVSMLSKSWDGVLKAWRAEKASILARPILDTGKEDEWRSWIVSPEATQYTAPYTLRLTTLITSSIRIRQITKRYDLGGTASTSWVIADPLEIDCAKTHEDSVARKISDLTRDASRLSGMFLLRLRNDMDGDPSERRRWVAYDWSRERHDVRVYTSLHVDEDQFEVVDAMYLRLQRIFYEVDEKTGAELEPIFAITPTMLQHDPEPSGPLAALALDSVVNRGLESTLAVLTRDAFPMCGSPNDLDAIRLSQRLALGKLYQVKKMIAQFVVDGKVSIAA